MFAEVYGYRVNLINVAIAVALYDLIHVFIELKARFDRFQEYESTDYGCMSDMFQSHCLATYSEIGVYSLDFVFTCFLIYGSSSVKLEKKKFSLKFMANVLLSSNRFRCCVGFCYQPIT